MERDDERRWRSSPATLADRNRRSMHTNTNLSSSFDPCTIFINNLPRGTGRWEVKEFFERFGRVARVYVCDRRRRWSSEGFAFINFSSSRDRMGLLQSNMDVWFRGRRLFIGVESKSNGVFRRRQRDATFRSHVKGTQHESLEAQKRSLAENALATNPARWSKRKGVRQEWRKKVRDIERVSLHDKGLRTITIDEVHDNLKWLKLSLVLKSEEPRLYADVFQFLAQVLNGSFRPIVIDHYTFLACFDSEQNRNLALQQRNQLASLFISVQPWRSFDRFDRRRVWLAIRGIPPQIWNNENINKIARLFGDVLETGGWSIDGVAMEEARVRVLTKDMGFISEEIAVIIGNLGVSVYVTECYSFDSDSWSIKNGQAALVDSASGRIGAHVNVTPDGNSNVPDTNSGMEGGRGAEGHVGGVVSSLRTHTTNVEYDLDKEEQLVNVQTRVGDGVVLVASTATSPPGFEGATNEVCIRNSNSNGAAPINALALGSLISSDSHIASQAVALVRLLDGQVEDENLAKEAIVAQRRSQRLAAKNS